MTDGTPYDLCLEFLTPDGREVSFSFSRAVLAGVSLEKVASDFYALAAVVRHDLASEMHMLLGVSALFEQVDSGLEAGRLTQRAVLKMSGGRGGTPEMVETLLRNMLEERGEDWHVLIQGYPVPV